MKITVRVFLFLFIALNISCLKPGTKALRNGDYIKAANQAIVKLQKKKTHKKASAVLPEAYKMAHNESMSIIAKYNNSDIPFSYETQLYSYDDLNDLFRKIENCSACRKLVNAKSYFKERDNLVDLAAEERYKYAMSFLNKNTLESGRIAHESFDILQKYAPNYKDVNQLLGEALEMGSLYVVVEPPIVNSRLYQLSNAEFVNKIEEYLNTDRDLNKYVRFFKPSEASDIKLKPDHVVTLEFLDFQVGNTSSKSEKKTVVSKDSVVTGSVVIDGKKVDVKGKVNADLILNEKTIVSRAILLMEIRDFRTQKVLFTERMPGDFIWKNSWATYNGDKRALTSEELALTTSKELLPPPPQMLFEEICKPIYSRITNKLRTFYQKY